MTLANLLIIPWQIHRGAKNIAPLCSTNPDIYDQVLADDVHSVESNYPAQCSEDKKEVAF